MSSITALGGRVGVASKDTRNAAAAKLLDVYYAQSNDDGATFLANVRVTDAAFDPNLGITASGGAFLGDYNGIASNSAGVHPIWADNRDVSSSTPQEPDIFTARDFYGIPLGGSTRRTGGQQPPQGGG